MASIGTIPDHVLIAGLQAMIKFLIERYEALGMEASGNWARQLEPVIENGTAIIKGMDYTEYLTQGRKPGGAPPVQVIFQWMLDKKSFRGAKTLSRAFAISKSIAKNGTSWYQKGGSDLIEVLYDPEVQRQFANVVGDHFRTSIRDEFIRQFQDLDT